MPGFSPLAAGPIASVFAAGGTIVIVIPPVTVTRGAPTSDILNNGWVPSTGTDLFAMLDEPVASSTDYIESDVVGEVCRMGIPNMTTPPNLLRYAASTKMGNGIIVSLYTLETIVGTWAHTLDPQINGVDKMYEIPLSIAQSQALAAGSMSVSFTLT